MNGRMTGRVRKRSWATKDGERSSYEYIVNLHPKPVTRSGYGTKQDAQTVLRDELDGRERGTWVEPSQETLAGLLNGEYLPKVEQAQRASTHDLYQRMARLHIIPHIGDLSLQSIRSTDVRKLYKKLREEGSDGGRGALGYSSLHNVHTVLHGALAYAFTEEKVRRNVADNCDPKRGADDDDGEEVAFWTPAQLGVFLDQVDLDTSEHVATERRERKGKAYTYQRHVDADPMLRALMYVFVATGARRGEVCGLRWPHIDTAGVVSVRRARVMVGGRVVDSKPKTKRGSRRVQLDEAAMAVLEEWREQQKRDRATYRQGWEDDADHVFTHAVRFSKPARYGVPVRPDWVTRAFHKVAARAGLPPLRLHGLRHSWATTAHLNGVTLRAIADQLGHADTSVTDRTYTATLQKVQDEAAAKVAASVTGSRGGGRQEKRDRNGTEGQSTE